MTEAEWLASQDAGEVLAYAARRVSPRRVRLAICACLRSPQAWRGLPVEASRHAVQVSESFAAQAIGSDELGRARKRANAVCSRSWQRHRDYGPTEYLANLVCLQDRNMLGYGLPLILAVFRRMILPVGRLRDVFGNPFRPVAVDPAWLAWNCGTVVHLAQAAYEERKLPGGHLITTRLAMLADALEDAGCSNPAILEHLRGPGPHVRGCWAVDLLLGKA